MAKPTKMTAELVEELVAWVSEGNTLAAFCRKHELGRRTVYDWLEADPELTARFARARELGADAIADDILSIADDGSNDTYIDDEGNEKTDQDVIQRSRLRVDARLKLLAKWFPQRYGDKVQVGGAADLPPLVKDATDIEIAARIEQIMSAARARRAQEKTDHGHNEGHQGAPRRRPRAARRKAKGS